MDWTHFLALIYFCTVTPLALLGLIVIYVFGAAFYSAREERYRKEHHNGTPRKW